jgi:hypothetical protein
MAVLARRPVTDITYPSPASTKRFRLCGDFVPNGTERPRSAGALADPSPIERDHLAPIGPAEPARAAPSQVTLPGNADLLTFSPDAFKAAMELFGDLIVRPAFVD